MEGGRPAKRAIVIAGPTASGKSALALALAEELGGTIINADSMQVYAGLRILTARPSPAETARAPHRLFGHVDMALPYSVGCWLRDVRAALDEAFAAGRLPVLVGGTGLYLQALTQGLSAMPEIPASIRAAVRERAEAHTSEELHAQLRSVDPLMAGRLRPSDPQRIARALEVFETTGRSLADFQGSRAPPILPASDIAAIFLDVPRLDLDRHIDRRLHKMVDEGALEEAALVWSRGLDPASPAIRVLGLAPFAAAAAGQITLPHALATTRAATRRYAKRQVTFARHQLPGLCWVNPQAARTALLDQLA